MNKPLQRLTTALLCLLFAGFSSLAQDWAKTDVFSAEMRETTLNMNFGQKVVLQENYGVILGNGNHTFRVPASLKVIKLNGEVWEELQNIEVSEVFLQYGAIDIDMEGNTIAITTNNSEVFIYEIDESDLIEPVKRTAVLTTTVDIAYDSSQRNLKFYNGTLAVSFNGKNVNGTYEQGQGVLIYENSGASWTDKTEDAVLWQEIGNYSSQSMYQSLDFKQDLIVVGTWNRSITSSNREGGVLLFKKPENGWTNMSATKVMLPETTLSDGYYGKSVALSEDATELYVGAMDNAYYGNRYGRLYIYKLNDEGEFVQNIVYDNNNKSCMDYVVPFEDHIAYGSTAYNDQFILHRKNNGNWDANAYNKKTFFGSNWDLPSNCGFTRSTSVSGDWMAVSVSSIDLPSGSKSGKVMLFKKPAAGWFSIAEPTQEITPTGTLSDSQNRFGTSAAVYGNYAAISASGYYDGAVFVYERQDNSWKKIATLTSGYEEGNTGMGRSLCMDENKIVCGATSGKAFVFEKPETGWADMTPTAELTVEGGNSGSLSTSIAMSGDVIAASSVIYNKPGEVYLFEKEGSSWSSYNHTATLKSQNQLSPDRFGCSLAMEGDILIVGEYGGLDNTSSGRGRVNVYQKPVDGWSDGLAPIHKIFSPQTTLSEQFGYNVALNGNRILVADDYDKTNTTGSTPMGNVYSFIANDDWTDIAFETNFQELIDFTNSLRYLGRNIVLLNNRAIIKDSNTNNRYGNYTFEYNETDGWQMVKQLNYKTTGIAASEDYLLVCNTGATGQDADAGEVTTYINAVDVTFHITGADDEGVKSSISLNDDNNIYFATDDNGVGVYRGLLPNNTYECSVSQTSGNIYKTYHGTITTSATNSIEYIQLEERPKVTFTVSYNGSPITNARVYFENNDSKLTDDNGQATFAGLYEGNTYSYQIIRNGYVTVEDEVEINAGATVINLNIELIKQSTLTFYITPSNATITFNGADYEVTNGRLNIQNIVEGTECSYSASAEGYQSSDEESFVMPNSNRTVTINLNQLHTASISVFYNQQPMAGATVLVDGEEFSTDAGGQVAYQNINGTYSIVVQSDGYDVYTNSFDITDEDTSVFVFMTATSINDKEASVCNVYPNPATSTTTIGNCAGAEVKIYDVTGALVKQIQNAAHNQLVDVSNWSKGIYIIKVNDQVIKLMVK